MKRNKKDTVSELSIQNRQKFILNRKVQIVSLVIAICCVSISFVKTKEVQFNALLGNRGFNESNQLAEELPQEIEEDNHSLEPDTKEDLTLYALSACLMDASNGRVLYDKDAYKEMPMASTTKIMTLLVTLENANLDDIVTISANAAKQPDVQLNIRSGEKYHLRDLVYSLMLESHNDTAVAIAEHVGGSVEHFCDMMTAKAFEIGAYNTSFKTPNGLDADGHYTTARDLSLIASYAIRNSDFCKIVKTQTHQFDEIAGKRSFSVNNKDRFLYMMDGAIGIKTGYTGKAGYCFVGAIKINGKTFVSSVLGSGWPPHKEYKWSDTKKLMNYGLNNFKLDYLFDHIKKDAVIDLPNTLPVYDGKKQEVEISLQEDLSDVKMLLADSEEVTTVLLLNEYIQAPIGAATLVGTMNYYIGKNLFYSIPIITKEEVEEVDFGYFFQKVLEEF